MRSRPISRLARILGVVVVPAVLAACGGSGGDAGTAGPVHYADRFKRGGESLIVVGDYFHHSYVLELLGAMRWLPPDSRKVVFCTEQYYSALEPFLAANDVTGVEYHTIAGDSPLVGQWARDIAVAGHSGDGHDVMVVTPDKHARTEAGAGAFARILGEAFPGYDIRLAPFVFEGGNLVFVTHGEETVLITGRKVLFDNAVYQAHSWTAGLDDAEVERIMAQTFGVDRVIVVGRAGERPPSHLYFEYHLDMGMVVLDDHRAVVSQVDLGDGDRADIAAACSEGRAVVSSFTGMENPVEVLMDRIETVTAEYDDYASVLEGLGLTVQRVPVGWEQVVSSMSWTNVVQAGGRLLMPLYPDTLRAVTRSVTESGGRTRRSLDVSVIGEENFVETGTNRAALALYRNLGYDVTTVPEYLHYMMGGVHCFVNVLR